MFQKIRIFFRYTIAWIVVIGCIGLIGFILYPLLSEKYNSMALRGNQAYTWWYTIKRWYPLEIERNRETLSGEIRMPTAGKTKLDAIEKITQKNINEKTVNFFQVFKEAFSTNTNKETVIYKQDEMGTYRGQ